MVEFWGCRRWCCFEVRGLPGEGSGVALPAPVGTFCDPPKAVPTKEQRCGVTHSLRPGSGGWCWRVAPCLQTRMRNVPAALRTWVHSLLCDRVQTPPPSYPCPGTQGSHWGWQSHSRAGCGAQAFSRQTPDLKAEPSPTSQWVSPMGEQAAERTTGKWT